MNKDKQSFRGEKETKENKKKTVLGSFWNLEFVGEKMWRKKIREVYEKNIFLKFEKI